MLAMLTMGKDFCILNTHSLLCINALSREFGFGKNLNIVKASMLHKPRSTIHIGF